MASGARAHTHTHTYFGRMKVIITHVQTCSGIAHLYQMVSISLLFECTVI